MLSPSISHEPAGRTPSKSLLIAWFVLPLLAVAITFPLIRYGCSCGHDIDFHLLIWLEGAAQLHHGTLFPHWAFSPAFYAGEPRFIFYPPVTWVLGELLAFAYWPAAYNAFIVIAVSAAGLSFYRLARNFASPNAALIAAALYMVNPYMLFTVYERSALGELMGATWLSLLLLALLRDKMSVAELALPLGLLWLTNVPAALMGSYVFAAVLLLRFAHIWISRRKMLVEIFGIALGSGLLGLCLAGVYLIPALWEGRWIQTAQAATAGLLAQNNTLFAHTGEPFHDAVLHTASILAVILLIFTLLTVLGLLLLRRRPSFARPAPTFVVPVLAALGLGIAFLMTPYSTSVWDTLPKLSLIQFSWRWLTMLGIIAALCFAMLLSRVHLRMLVSLTAMVVLGAALIPTCIHLFRQDCEYEDGPTGMKALFDKHTGFYQADEMTPNGADNDALQHGNPAYWLSPNPATEPHTSDDETSPPLPENFLVDSPQKQFLILNLRNYPAWQVRVNGTLVPHEEYSHRNDGLIALPIIAGTSAVNISYVITADITLGRLVTLLALALLIGLIYMGRSSPDLSSTER